MKFLLSGAILTGVLALGICASANASDRVEGANTAAAQNRGAAVITTKTSSNTIPQAYLVREARQADLYVYNANAQEDRIVMQHPLSRELMICDSETFAVDGVISPEVERCARDLEKFGFVRLTEIPRFTAEGAEKEDAVYPSRRYRHNDLTPRW